MKKKINYYNKNIVYKIFYNNKEYKIMMNILILKLYKKFILILLDELNKIIRYWKYINNLK